MKIVQKENGWVQVGDSAFAKKIADNLFEVIRIETNNEIHLDFYNRVRVSSIKAEDIGEYGDYNEFLKLGTDEEKAAYLAFVAYTYDHTVICENVEEAKSILEEENVIVKGEALTL